VHNAEMESLKPEKPVTLELLIQELIVALISALSFLSSPSVEMISQDLAESFLNAEDSETKSFAIQEEISQRVKNVEAFCHAKLATLLETAAKDLYVII